MPRYWFGQKTFGYGSTPNTWQGWLITLIFLALILALMVGTNYVVIDPSTRTWTKGIGLIVLTVPFLWVVFSKTSPD